MVGGARSQRRHVLEHVGLVELVIQVQNLFLDGTVVVGRVANQRLHLHKVYMKCTSVVYDTHMYMCGAYLARQPFSAVHIALVGKGAKRVLN